MIAKDLSKISLNLSQYVHGVSEVVTAHVDKTPVNNRSSSCHLYHHIYLFTGSFYNNVVENRLGLLFSLTLYLGPVYLGYISVAYLVTTIKCFL